MPVAGVYVGTAHPRPSHDEETLHALEGVVVASHAVLVGQKVTPVGSNIQRWCYTKKTYL